MKTREEEYCTLRDEAVKRGRTESGTPTRGRPTEQGLSLGSRAGGGGEGGGGGFNGEEREDTDDEGGEGTLESNESLRQFFHRFSNS